MKGNQVFLHDQLVPIAVHGLVLGHESTGCFCKLSTVATPHVHCGTLYT
jgi:hypothetical protein